MTTMKTCCPACHSESVQRIACSNINGGIAYQYRTSIDKGVCGNCGSLWSFRSVVPHLALKLANLPSYQ